ncbi:hypothetical protein Scep_022554 [Stephania cephalantha]|uniref:Uncharacterized protein n=1 Tax=Stephania cephalantha TaxID=152367 RepID=A0AAP0F874_9MAGN
MEDAGEEQGSDAGEEKWCLTSGGGSGGDDDTGAAVTLATTRARARGESDTAAARDDNSNRRAQGSSSDSAAMRARWRDALRTRGTRGATRATARWRVAGPIDPRRDNNSGQGVVTSTKLDKAMDSNGFWIRDLHEGHGT